MPSTGTIPPAVGEKRGSLTGAALTDEVFDSSPTLLHTARGGEDLTGLQQYFTPPEAARLIAEVNGRIASTLDLTAGDGALLAPIEPDVRFGIEIDADQIDPKFYEAINGDVDFENGNLLLGASEDAEKSEAARRVVPMVRQLRDWVSAECLRQGKPETGLVCPPRRESKSKLLSVKNLLERRAKIWEDRGLKPIGIQDSRHTAATWLDHAGVSPKVVSALMGHKAPARQAGAAPITLRTYTHVLPGELERARDQLQDFLDTREAKEANEDFAHAA